MFTGINLRSLVVLALWFAILVSASAMGAFTRHVIDANGNAVETFR